MLPIYVDKSLPTAADDNGIALSQSPGGAGNLTLNGVTVVSGVAYLAEARRVIITSAGNDSAKTFTVYGSRNGIPQQESFAGAAIGAAQSALDYDTITRIAVSAATAGAVIAGTNGVGSSRWVSVDGFIAPTGIAVAVVVEGTVNYTIQYTYDRYWLPPEQPNGPSREITVWDDSVLAAETTNGQTTFSFPVTGIRCTINSGTGSVQMTVFQAGGIS